MENFLDETQDGTPRIELNVDSGVFLFEGKSFPENADQYYIPVIQWFKSYVINPNKTTRIVFKLDYFDSASSKQLLEILLLLKDIEHSLTVEWNYFEDDDDMFETAKEFEELLEMNFVIVSHELSEK